MDWDRLLTLAGMLGAAVMGWGLYLSRRDEMRRNADTDTISSLERRIDSLKDDYADLKAECARWEERYKAAEAQWQMRYDAQEQRIQELQRDVHNLQQGNGRLLKVLKKYEQLFGPLELESLESLADQERHERDNRAAIENMERYLEQKHGTGPRTVIQAERVETHELVVEDGRKKPKLEGKDDE